MPGRSKRQDRAGDMPLFRWTGPFGRARRFPRTREVSLGGLPHCAQMDTIAQNRFHRHHHSAATLAQDHCPPFGPFWRVGKTAHELARPLDGIPWNAVVPSRASAFLGAVLARPPRGGQQGAARIPETDGGHSLPHKKTSPSSPTAPSSASSVGEYRQDLIRKRPLLRPGCLAFSVSKFPFS